MASKTVDVMFGGKFGRIDPSDHSAQPRIWFDQDAPSDDTEVEATQPDSRYMLRFVKANVIICFLGAPDAPIGSYVRCFETRPADARGGNESPLIGTWSNKMTSAQVECGASGQHWWSCALTVVER